jgi:lipopolysaccharide export system protein LptA
MKRTSFLAAVGSFFTVVVVSWAQAGVNPAEPGRSPLFRRGTEDGKPAVPVENPEKRAKGPTEITAREATFDNRAHLATFTGDVVVKDPEFNVTCDSMIVHLKVPPEKAAAPANGKPAGEDAPASNGKSGEKSPSESPGGAKPPPGPEPKPAANPGSGIEKAIAEGNVVIIQEKLDAEGKTQRYTGKGRKAVYESATGNVTLYGWPQIGQDIGGSMSKQIIAREEGCIMTLNRIGKIDVKGFHTTTLQPTNSPEKSPR